jgi:gas vesicle protein
MIVKVFKTLGVFWTGAAIGAGVALLYAPQDGRRTRRNLARFGTRKLHQLRDFQEDISSFVSDKVDGAWQSSKRLPHRIWPRAS